MKNLVSDELWDAIMPLLPVRLSGRGSPKGGRPAIDDRAALGGILFVLRTGVPWCMLPIELGCGSGVTCWRRLRDWQAAGVWRRLHQVLLERLAEAGQLDWSRAAIDARSLAAKRGGECTGPNPTDRGRPGSKHHILVERQGIPLVMGLSAADMHDSQGFETLLDAVRPVHSGQEGKPRRWPHKLHADKAYGSVRCRKACEDRGIVARIARRGIESSQRLGRYRWVVERTFAWLARYRRLVIRYERRADLHLAFLTLGCAQICLRFLRLKSL